ncbi:hypothetical protein [Kitasatospora sp. Root107]|uniref:hypothetical protein n=1 Tax=Kitasatospora sp. Root107 TaxID=1736424 RepID=UPI0007102D75|nr:hypothetical protein [Kitasatospora sp. Root107]KQV13701.1 hypothetical protein ASC99_33535 [Kitasatospora sp. Root107]
MAVVLSARTLSPMWSTVPASSRQSSATQAAAARMGGHVAEGGHSVSRGVDVYAGDRDQAAGVVPGAQVVAGVEHPLVEPVARVARREQGGQLRQIGPAQRAGPPVADRVPVGRRGVGEHHPPQRAVALHRVGGGQDLERVRRQMGEEAARQYGQQRARECPRFGGLFGADEPEQGGRLTDVVQQGHRAVVAERVPGGVRPQQVVEIAEFHLMERRVTPETGGQNGLVVQAEQGHPLTLSGAPRPRCRAAAVKGIMSG